MANDLDFFGAGGFQDVSTSSSGDESDSHSVDSAEQRAAEAQARLKDFGAEAAKQQQQQASSAALPSALDAFEVTGKPGFLDPESTRPLAVSSTHGLMGGGPSSGAVQTQRRRKGQLPAVGEEFDIALLAPRLKKHQQESAEKRGPPGSVIEGKAKRYKSEDELTGQYTAAQIAMMGGNVEHLLDDDSAPTAAGAAGPAGPGGAGGSKHDRGAATKPMAVSDFLDRGVGGAVLPRKRQDRKDLEKEKRAKGQSTHAHWKTEAEMVLRQQYD